MSSILPGSVAKALDKALYGTEEHQKAAAAAATTSSEHNEADEEMEAVAWDGKKQVKTITCKRPTVTDDNDAIIRMTSSAICGSDLHLFGGNMPGMSSGMILGHEAMGIVIEVGKGVKNVKVGDRVVTSFCMGCGDCFFCKKQLYSACDKTNPSAVQEEMMGARSAGMLGYSGLTGAFAGAQADVYRMPFADTNCLVLPPVNELSDEKLLFLSDILPTAWHGNELAGVGKGDIVAVWGAGPVGILAAQCAFARGARRVIVVDKLAYRLEEAKRMVPGVETVDFSTGGTAERQVLDLCKQEPGGGPDCIIEAVGMHYCNSFVHKFEMMVGFETDSPEALNAAFTAVRKGGRIGCIGVYAGYANHFNIGALMEKGLTIAAGQTPVQRYWKDLLEKVRQGVLKPEVIITHHMPLKDASQAYKMFDDKTDGVVKVILHPSNKMPQQSAATTTTSTTSAGPNTTRAATTTSTSTGKSAD